MITEKYMLPASWSAALTTGNLTGLSGDDAQRLAEWTRRNRDLLAQVSEINLVRDCRAGDVPEYDIAFHDAWRERPHRVPCHQFQFVFRGKL